MSIGRFTAATVALMIAWSATAASAEVLWMPIGYPELIADSDLIVVGKISQIARGVHDEGTFNCSRIQVSEVLKGQVPGGGIRLDYPCRNPTVLEGEVAPPPSPTDIFLEEGQEGVWFLKAQEQGDHFMVNHPGRFKPVLFVSRVKQEIRKAAM